ncbi:MAG: hypothetical protein K2L82_12565 [Lachnospiraceae bacterium]|nr:hypothetical protein [Lachnospiraceae bacterium]
MDNEAVNINEEDTKVDGVNEENAIDNDNQPDVETPREKKAREEREAREREFRAKKRRLIPPFVMLLAGAITSITMRMLHYDTKTMLIILLGVLLGFYIAGCVIKGMLDRFEKQIEEADMEEGEVIEKELAEEDKMNRNSEANVKDE